MHGNMKRCELNNTCRRVRRILAVREKIAITGTWSLAERHHCAKERHLAQAAVLHTLVINGRSGGDAGPRVTSQYLLIIHR